MILEQLSTQSVTIDPNNPGEIVVDQQDVAPNDGVVYEFRGDNAVDAEIVSEDDGSQTQGRTVPEGRVIYSGAYRATAAGRPRYLYGSSAGSVTVVVYRVTPSTNDFHGERNEVIEGDDGTGTFSEMHVDSAVNGAHVARQRSSNHLDPNGNGDFAEGGVAYTTDAYIYEANSVDAGDGATNTIPFTLFSADEKPHISVDGSGGEVTVTVKFYRTAARNTVINSEQLATTHSSMGDWVPTINIPSPYGELVIDDTSADSDTDTYEYTIQWQ
ncbi:MAG: hypothetical protein ABEN55_00665 [Bradymonadaceae bacterium]